MSFKDIGCAGLGVPRTNPQARRLPAWPTIADGRLRGLREPNPQPSRPQHLAPSFASARKARPRADCSCLVVLSRWTEPTSRALSNHWRQSLPTTAGKEPVAEQPALQTPLLPQRPVRRGLERGFVSLLRHG